MIDALERVEHGVRIITIDWGGEGLEERVALVYATVPWEVAQDAQRSRELGQRYAITFTSWRDEEDDVGPYRASVSTWSWPMTYATRRAAQAAIAEYLADNYGDVTVEIARQPSGRLEAGLRRQAERWLRRARRRP